MNITEAAKVAELYREYESINYKINSIENMIEEMKEKGDNGYLDIRFNNMYGTQLSSKKDAKILADIFQIIQGLIRTYEIQKEKIKMQLSEFNPNQKGD